MWIGLHLFSAKTFGQVYSAIIHLYNYQQWYLHNEIRCPSALDLVWTSFVQCSVFFEEFYIVLLVLYYCIVLYLLYY